MAIRAMVMAGAKDEANKTGVELLETLASVSDAYLAQFPKKDEEAWGQFVGYL